MSDDDVRDIQAVLPRWKPYEVRPMTAVNGGKTAERKNAKMRERAGLFADDEDFVFSGHGEVTTEKIDRKNQRYADKINDGAMAAFRRALQYRNRLCTIIGSNGVEEFNSRFVRIFPHSPANYADCLFQELIRCGVSREEIMQMWQNGEADVT